MEDKWAWSRLNKHTLVISFQTFLKSCLQLRPFVHNNFSNMFLFMKEQGLKEVSKCQDFFFFFFLLAAFSLLWFQEFGGGFVVVFCFQNPVDANPFLIAEFGFDVMSWAISKEVQSRNDMKSYASITKSSFRCDKAPYMVK